MFKIYLSLFLAAFAGYAYSQDFNDYQPLQSSGKVPADFTKLSSQKYQEDRSTISKEDKRRVRKAKDKFFLQSNFNLSDILLSGKILFNDPVSSYVNKVADKLLENNTTLRNKLRIYVVKSGAVNAFATNDGMVFINLGLISQLENEAQLAFILSHEITHFEKKHILNSFIETEKIKSGKGAYRGLSTEEKYFSKNNYSKEVEMEADLGGLELYDKSPYTKAAIPSVFNVLNYSYLPFDDVVFDQNYFNTENLLFPNDYFLSKTDRIKGDEDFDDSKSTHPNTQKRRTAVTEKMGNAEDGKQLYLVSKEEFENARKISRYEICRIYLLKEKYEAAIYHTYLLLKKDPASKYLKKTMAKALYGLSKYANHGNFTDIHKEYKNFEGCSQQVYYFFDKLKYNELNILALINLWKLKKEFPDDIEIRMMTDDIFKELVEFHYSSRTQFYTKSRSTRMEETKVDSLKTLASDSLSKYDKIRNQQTIAEAEAEGQESFIRYALVDLLDDKEFSNRFDALIEEKKDKEKEERQLSYKEKRERTKKEHGAIDKNGYALGMDKVVIVNPFYYRIDQRKKEAIRYQETEDGQQKLDDQLRLNAQLVDLNIELVDPNSATATDVNVFNENSQLTEWFSEKLNHDEWYMVSPIYEDVLAISKKHGTKNFCWTGLISTSDKKDGNHAFVLLTTLITVYALPAGICYIATPEHRCYYFTFVFDVESEEMKMKEFMKIYSKDSKAVIHSHLYYSLLQIKIKENEKDIHNIHPTALYSSCPGTGTRLPGKKTACELQLCVLSGASTSQQKF